MLTFKSLLLAFVLFASQVLLQIGYSKDAPRAFENPILPGFYPDPSVCRVGNDYYMVHSTFEYFPGVPIFHSKDLVHWQQIGHVLTRKSQLKLDKMRASGGIFAPTIRYHKGTYYMITTLVSGRGNFYVTAKDPAGPWSDPVWLDQDGIDPSLLFDEDGTVYYTRHAGGERGYISQQILNLQTGKLGGDTKQLWKGTGGAWPEGPHLYKINGKYYLMISEGGTSYNHRLTIARSDSPWGPFEPNPSNPILTHRNRPDHPFQALGHGDLVETPNGWWIVFLGFRPQGGKFHHLGRETFLAPVPWSDDGWPVVNGNGTIETLMPAPRLPERRWKGKPARDPFTKPELGLEWNFLRNPYEKDFSLKARQGWLRLNGSAVTVNDQDSPAFVGRRQAHLSCKMSARLSFNPQHDNEEAGLVLRGNDKNHYDLGLTLKDGKRQVFLRKMLGGKVSGEVVFTELPAGDSILEITATPLEYEFSFHSGKTPKKMLGTATTRDLSSEKVGGFTGVYVGMYATGNGSATTCPADFDWFEYQLVK